MGDQRWHRVDVAFGAEMLPVDGCSVLMDDVQGVLERHLLMRRESSPHRDRLLEGLVIEEMQRKPEPIEQGANRCLLHDLVTAFGQRDLASLLWRERQI